MKKQLLLSVIFGILLTFGAFAQEKGLNDKLKKIEGKAESIVVKTDKGTFTFSGKEADAVMKILMSKKSAKKVIVINGEDDFSWNENDDVDVDELRIPLKKLKIFHGSDQDGNIEIELSDLLDSSNSGKIHKKVVIQNRDGNKTVTVTTKENGTEQIEMFEGKDAEKYIEEHKSDETKDESAPKGMKKKVKKIVIENEDKK